MLFNSLTFLVFFAVMLMLHYTPLPWKIKKINLLLGSYLFYAAWNPVFILLLWLSTVVDFFVGRALYHTENRTRRKLLLVLSLAGNLGMLCYFKYGSFLLENFTALMSVLGIEFQAAKPDIILPAGISFYTFTTLCYTVDMYKRESKPVQSLLDFSLFVTFFPHLVAGPIVRPPQLVPQFESPRQATRLQFVQGLMLLVLGLFMKVVLADTLLAGPSDTIFGFPGLVSTVDAWTGVFAFTGQIFFDFAGYSTCAIGAAMCLGFSLPENFRYPYAASGFSDFWKRWHISLSQWLRDYVYIPLGGNRKGVAKTYVNLMATMLLGGLWHGASWTFVVWGGLHGLFLCVERWWNRKRDLRACRIEPETTVRVIHREDLVLSGTSVPRSAITPFVKALGVFLLVSLTWVFFRADSFAGAGRLFAAMFSPSGGGAPLLTTIDILKVAIVTTAMVLVHWRMRNSSVSQLLQKISWVWAGLLWGAMLILILLSQKSSDSFIYFQF